MRGLFVGLVVLALAAPAAASAETALVDVSVATLWKAPNLARSLDAPSLTKPVDLDAWNRNLASTASRVWLDTHVQTQALYGQRVHILARRGGWAKVVVDAEPDSQDRRGYPGWVPLRQLRLDADKEDFGGVVVTAPRVWLRSRSGERLLELSFATWLPLLRLEAARVVVQMVDGRTAILPRTAVRVLTPPLHRPTGAEVVATARRFLGLRYLWGGLSGWGFDCSGLVWAVYQSYGWTIPRDADPQFRGVPGRLEGQLRHGRPVATSALRPGDLVFYGSQRYVHHVAIYAGGGRMLEAPDSAHAVRLVPMRWRELAGARRY